MVERQVVVGAAIVRDGRVLAARRTAPASAAGRWEFPGGKVEPGETEADSLVREIDEELGVRITVVEVARRVRRRSASATCCGSPSRRWTAASRRPTEHDQVRWLAADELARRGLAGRRTDPS